MVGGGSVVVSELWLGSLWPLLFIQHAECPRSILLANTDVDDGAWKLPAHLTLFSAPP